MKRARQRQNAQRLRNESAMRIISLTQTNRDFPLAYRAIRGGLWVALGSYSTIGFGFMANILLTRLLTPDAFGTFALAMFFAQLLRLEPKLGLAQAFGQHKELSEEAIGTFLFLNVPIILGGFLLTLLAAPILLEVGYDVSVVHVMLVLALAALLESASGLAGVMLDKELRFAPLSLLQSLVFPLSYMPAFWLATHGGGVWSLVSQTLTYSALLLGTWWLTRRQLPAIWRMRWRFSRPLARQFLGFGVTVGLWFMAGMLFSQLDNFFIGTFVGLTALGYYDRAYRMAQWPALLFNMILSRTAFYTYAQLQDDRPRLDKTAAMVTWGIGMIAIPLALAILIAAPDIVVLLYGERWLPSALFLQTLIAFFVIRPHLENAGVLLNAIGKPARAAVLTWAQVGVVGIAGVPLTLQWGALGTCAAVGLALLVGSVVAFEYVRREAFNPLKVLGPLLSVGILILLGYWLGLQFLLPDDMSGNIPAERPLRLVAKGAYVFVAFFVLAFALDPQGMSERARYIWRLWRADNR